MTDLPADGGDTVPHHPPATIPSLLTLKQVGVILQVSERSVRRLIISGDLHAIRVGRSPRVRRRDLEAFIQGAPDYQESKTDEAE